VCGRIYAEARNQPGDLLLNDFDGQFTGGHDSPAADKENTLRFTWKDAVFPATNGDIINFLNIRIDFYYLHAYIYFYGI